jgi:hypothetical protein
MRLKQSIPKTVTSSPRSLPVGVAAIPEMVTLSPQDGYLTASKPLPHKAMRNLKVLKVLVFFKKQQPPLVVFFRCITVHSKPAAVRASRAP